MKHFIPIFLIFSLVIPITAQGALDYSGLEAAISNTVNPSSWFDLFGKVEKNFLKQIPSVSGTEELKLPTPEEALKQASPKLQEINVSVREETGIDFAKFLGWLAKVFRTFASVFIGLLETASESLKTKE